MGISKCKATWNWNPSLYLRTLVEVFRLLKRVLCFHFQRKSWCYRHSSVPGFQVSLLFTVLPTCRNMLFPEVQQVSLIYALIIGHYFLKGKSDICEWTDNSAQLEYWRLCFNKVSMWLLSPEQSGANCNEGVSRTLENQKIVRKSSIMNSSWIVSMHRSGTW